jgi:hypothetical protein
VDAVVTMAASAVCLELSTTAIDFGLRRFGEVNVPATPFIGITNCGGIGEAILARGSDATGPGASAWSLVDAGLQLRTLHNGTYRLTGGSVTLGPTTFRHDEQRPACAARRAQARSTRRPGSPAPGCVSQILFVAVRVA